MKPNDRQETITNRKADSVMDSYTTPCVSYMDTRCYITRTDFNKFVITDEHMVSLSHDENAGETRYARVRAEETVGEERNNRIDRWHVQYSLTKHDSIS